MLLSTEFLIPCNPPPPNLKGFRLEVEFNQKQNKTAGKEMRDANSSHSTKFILFHLHETTVLASYTDIVFSTSHRPYHCTVNMWLKLPCSFKLVSRSLTMQTFFFFSLKIGGKGFRGKGCILPGTTWGWGGLSLQQFFRASITNPNASMRESILLGVLVMLLSKALLIYLCLWIILGSDWKRLVSVFLSAWIQ